MLSLVFERDGGYPRMFREDGAYAPLIEPPGAAGETMYDREVSRVYALAIRPCIPLRARQTLYELHAGAHGEHGWHPHDLGRWCPVCAALSTASDDWGAYWSLEHAVLHCPLARLIWHQVLTAWTEHLPRQTWTDGPAPQSLPDCRLQDFACTADIRRAVLIGLRPDDQREHADPFALLRAITVHELYRHSTRLRRRSHAMGLDPRGGDLPAGVEAVYSSIRHAFQRAAAGELRRCVDIERWLRARGRLPPGRGPVHEWKDRWVSPGFCELDGLVCTQTLLPASSPALPPSPP